MKSILVPKPKSAAEKSASGAVSRAIGELSTSQRRRIKGLSTSVKIEEAKPGTSTFAAIATNPITFFTKQGSLKAKDLLGTARHEVAHHLLDASPSRDVNREHFTIAASRVSKSSTNLRQVDLVSRLSPSRRQQRRLKTRDLGLRKADRGLPIDRRSRTFEDRTAGKVPGPRTSVRQFSHPSFKRSQNRAVQSNPLTSQKTLARAREQARKSGIRVKRKGVDF